MVGTAYEKRAHIVKLFITTSLRTSYDAITATTCRYDVRYG